MDSCSAWSGLGPVGRQKEHELEGESPEMLGVHVRPFYEYEKEKSLFEAIINGANAGVKMIVGIAALLIAVLGLVVLKDRFSWEISCVRETFERL